MAPVINRTIEFREAVKAKEQRYPPTKRVAFGKNRNANATVTNDPVPPPPLEDGWTKQAEQVVRSHSLSHSPAPQLTCTLLAGNQPPILLQLPRLNPTSLPRPRFLFYFFSRFITNSYDRYFKRFSSMGRS